jgi:SAM-dependent methyltransferase
VSAEPLSPALRAFLAEAPHERRHILDFVRRAAATVPRGADVLDAGAGDAPYRELFAAHCYRTQDWTASVHPGARAADVVGSLEDIPVPDASFDSVICTQVLEHVARPDLALAEIRRILRPGGSLWLTVPFVGELHEEPHDHFRYTSHGLLGLAERAGLTADEVTPLGGYFTAMAQLARNCGAATGVGAGAGLGRRLVAAGMRGAGHVLARMDGLDERHALPVGWAMVARRPA